MKPFLAFSALIIFTDTTVAQQTNPSIPPLVYDHPADSKHWATEGLPIGNGRLGAMLFGGTTRERIQFNEISLWGGANNWDGGFDTGDKGFGGYRNLGDLWISWGGVASSEVVSPSGHAEGNGQGIVNTLDDDANSKWCIEAPGTSVVWQAELSTGKKVSTYSLTSASDVPARDPQSWTLAGSMDGKSWVELDRRSPNQPFEKRGEKRSFSISTPGNYRFYRLIFAPPAGASHFQVAGIELDGVSLHNDAAEAKASTPADYRMTLDLETGVHRTSFTRPDDAKISREAFASRPDQVMVFRYVADRKGAISGRLDLKPGQAGAKISANAKGISFEGTMANGLRYATILRVLNKGGQAAAQGDSVVLQNCDEVTLLLAARTDYKPSFTDNWRTKEAPMPLVERDITAAQSRSADQLRIAHTQDFAKLMNACAVDLGATSPQQAALTTPERLRRYTDEGRFKSGGDDPGLEAQVFQMGRYLLVSSSRPGGLPANLQGLWNDSNNPAWASDYHTNINIQMNYWPAETTNLGECAVPLMDFIREQAEACRVATRKAFGEKTRGWTARTSQSPFGGNGWEWNIPASAWYALHVYDHWDFARDETFLRKTAYPLLKEICEYWEDRLKKLPDGTLVAPDGWSPEHGPREDGVMHDQQLIWELFDDYLRTAKALGVDPDYQKKVQEMQSQLAPNKIGKWGQLQEWQTDRDDPNNRHRHTSHLFALYPGRQISLTGTPELAQAAKISLLARSNDSSDKTGAAWNPAQMHAESVYGWVWPWRAAMWARLGEGNRAHTLIWGKGGNTAPNMLGLNLPYFRNRQELIQLDNSFGATAAMAEMLLQSHTGEIHLLPALPTAWKKQGSFRGMRGRGGFAVDCAWKDGLPTAIRIQGKPGTTAVVRHQQKVVRLTVPANGILLLNETLAPVS